MCEHTYSKGSYNNNNGIPRTTAGNSDGQRGVQGAIQTFCDKKREIIVFLKIRNRSCFGRCTYERLSRGVCIYVYREQ